MKTSKIIDIAHGLKLHLHNKCCARGWYYGEDDWALDIIGENDEEIIALAVPEIVKTGIHIDSAWLFSADYIIYDGQKVILKETEMGQNAGYELLTKIRASELFKRSLAENDERKQEATRKGIEQEKEEQRALRRAEYLKLKQEFEQPTSLNEKEI